MVDVSALKAELAAILGAALPKARPSVLRLPKARFIGPRRPDASRYTANLLTEIETAAHGLGLDQPSFGRYLLQVFGTEDLGRLSNNDLVRVLRHLEIQATTQN